MTMKINTMNWNETNEEKRGRYPCGGEGGWRQREGEDKASDAILKTILHSTLSSPPEIMFVTMSMAMSQAGTSKPSMHFCARVPESFKGLI